MTGNACLPPSILAGNPDDCRASDEERLIVSSIPRAARQIMFHTSWTE
ncbi:MAG TPA: hypothetical protein VHX38_12900 [Pseudonocardiaceae bacterium]|jgi:hypothetical protein|nr:hypothetical protein [Pseudonocardiaceae bacterium]